jgi:ElaB/YqjD/DUF883 family membrane-anchored ribosome-binding protein
MNMQKNTRSQSNQSANVQLQALLSEVSNVLKKIDETISDSVAQLNEINSRVNESIAKVEKIFSELDQIEKDAGDEMDKLILQQAEALAEE